MTYAAKHSLKVRLAKFLLKIQKYLMFGRSISKVFILDSYDPLLMYIHEINNKQELLRK